MVTLAAASVVILIAIVAVLCVKSKSYKYKSEYKCTGGRTGTERIVGPPAGQRTGAPCGEPPMGAVCKEKMARVIGSDSPKSRYCRAMAKKTVFVG